MSQGKSNPKVAMGRYSSISESRTLSKPSRLRACPRSSGHRCTLSDLRPGPVLIIATEILADTWLSVPTYLIEQRNGHELVCLNTVGAGGKVC